MLRISQARGLLPASESNTAETRLEGCNRRWGSGLSIDPPAARASAVLDERAQPLDVDQIWRAERRERSGNPLLW